MFFIEGDFSIPATRLPDGTLRYLCLLAILFDPQLIVTTHSDILVDAMTERPDFVVVCEKHDGQTRMRRLHKT